MDPKKRLFRLIEVYLNEYRKNEVEEIYGKGTKIKIHTMEQRSDEWHEVRKGKMTASNAICISQSGKGLQSYIYSVR